MLWLSERLMAALTVRTQGGEICPDICRTARARCAYGQPVGRYGEGLCNGPEFLPIGPDDGQGFVGLLVRAFGKQRGNVLSVRFDGARSTL